MTLMRPMRQGEPRKRPRSEAVIVVSPPSGTTPHEASILGRSGADCRRDQRVRSSARERFSEVAGGVDGRRMSVSGIRRRNATRSEPLGKRVSRHRTRTVRSPGN